MKNSDNSISSNAKNDIDKSSIDDERLLQSGSILFDKKLQKLKNDCTHWIDKIELARRTAHQMHNLHSETYYFNLKHDMFLCMKKVKVQ